MEMPVTATPPPMIPAVSRETSAGILSSARIVSACILLSRLLGLVRDVLLAGLFGGGRVNDAFVLATLVPNLFRRFFGEGALTAAFIPAYADAIANKSRAEADRFARSAMTLLALFLGVVAAGGMGVCGGLARTLGDPKGRLVADLLVVLLPYMPLICLVALVTGILNVHRHFLLPALASSVLNLFEIAAFFAVGWFAATEEGKARVIAWSITAAGLGQLLLQVPALRAHKVPLAPLPKWEPGVKRMLATMAPMTFGIAVFQINVLVDNAVAEAMVPGDGAVSALYFANRLFNFPIALIGLSIAQAAFPEFADAFARGRREEVAGALAKSFRMVLVLAIPASVGLCVLATPIIRMIFEHGNFSEPMARRSGAVLAFYGLGTWAACAQHVITRAFFAARDAKTPAVLGAGAVFFNLALNLTFVHWWREAGLALATSITAAVQLVILCVLLRRNVPEIRWLPIFGWCVRPVLAAGAMAAAALGLLHVLPNQKYVQGLAPVAAGAIVYFAGALLLRVPEAREVFAFRRHSRNLP
ncbi:MAG: virulence [Planctomycetota bacterium]|nr:MAG: virulence [Planctomycetota bacterium]